MDYQRKVWLAPDSNVPKVTFANSATQGIAAIADQGLFAISNFALNLMLARHMAKADFGAFSAAFATFLILATIYTAVITEPMLIFALSSRAVQQRTYVNKVSVLHWRGAILVSAVVLAIGLARYSINPQMSTILAYGGWAIAAPMVLWLWFARRTAYITRTPHRAAFAGAGYLICMIALLGMFGPVVAKYPFVPCILFAIPSVVIAQVLRATVPLRDLAPSQEMAPSTVWTIHWTYGRWASLGSLCAAITGQVYFFVMPLDKCAAYRALLNIPMPLLQTYTALGPAFIALFTPLRGRSQFGRTVTMCLFVVSGASLVLGLGAAFSGKNLLHILYSDKYIAYSAALLPLMIYSCLGAATVVLDSAMRSMEMVQTATAASVTAVAVSVVFGVPASIAFGVSGATYGLLGSQLFAFSILVTAWFKVLRGTTSSIKGGSPHRVLCVQKPGGTGNEI